MKLRLFTLVAVLALPVVASGQASVNASYASHEVRSKKEVGRARLRFDKPASQPLVLQSFAFSFGNGDHKISTVHAMPFGPEQAEVELSDVDSNDPYSVWIKWLAIPGLRIRTPIRRGCVATCSVAIERPNPGEVFALSGFSFFHNPRRDSNMRQIAIRPKPDLGVVDVVFRDNGGATRFDVQLHHTYLPASVAGKPESRSGRTRRESPNQVILQKSATPGVLQGFDIGFVNGDHYIRDLSIVGLAGGTTLSVVFNDKNYDDPIDATVDYVLLK